MDVVADTDPPEETVTLTVASGPLKNHRHTAFEDVAAQRLKRPPHSVLIRHTDARLVCPDCDWTLPLDVDADIWTAWFTGSDHWLEHARADLREAR